MTSSAVTSASVTSATLTCRRHAGVCVGMVQPQPEGPMQWDMSGDESGGVLRVPPELAANEVVTRLLNDNQQLRGNNSSKVKEFNLTRHL